MLFKCISVMDVEDDDINVHMVFFGGTRDLLHLLDLSVPCNSRVGYGVTVVVHVH